MPSYLIAAWHVSILSTLLSCSHQDDGSYDTIPNIICYNTVLNACAFSAQRTSGDEQKRALEVAVDTFKMLDGRYATADAVSYGNMLKVFANLMPTGDARTSMSTTIFKSCCEEGSVGGLVLDEIRRCVPAKQFIQILAKCGYDKPMRQHQKAIDVQLRALPRQWTANVKKSDGRQRQRNTSKHQPEKLQTNRKQEKTVVRPVFRKPSMLIETASISGKDL